MRERQNAAAAFLRDLEPLETRTLLEVGAASGSNVPYHQALGFRSENIVLNDVRPEPIAEAVRWAPLGVRAIPGDAAVLDLAPFDVVYAATVFTSILSDEHRRAVAAGLWRLTKAGGGVLLYDFAWNNPRNPDVRKLTLLEIRALFPAGEIRSARLTLAPPIARHIPARLYPLVNRPWLRTHLMCWLPKYSDSQLR
jgi:Methyltransferase domain